MWVPAHIGLPGNETADELAKKGTVIANIPSAIPITLTDYKAHLNQTNMHTWQLEWNQKSSNKLHEIKKNIKKWNTQIELSREQNVTLTRLRIGHTNITHRHLMLKTEAPICTNCNQFLTVKHILIQCPKYNKIRHKTKLDTQLEHILRADPYSIKRLFKFLKAARNWKNHLFDSYPLPLHEGLHSINVYK